MVKTVVLPPDEKPTDEGIKAGGWWHEAEGGAKLVCDVCPRACALKPGDRGFCFVRQNLDGRIVSTTYGRSTGFCVDPIEKKPLDHFYPGTPVLSFGTAGCNLGCKFCQNWSISKSRQVESLSEAADPEQIAEAARQLQCRSVAFTYNDPVIWAEYAIDTARACRAVGVKTVAVTAGYITPVARKAFYEVMDAANVDLKGFTEQFYWKLSAGHLEPVRDTLRWLVRETDVWVEITNLIIPRANDSPDELKSMCEWILEDLGPDVPLHFTAFHPDFRLTDRGPTPAETLALAHDLARRAGLRYVYTGNLHDPQRQSTYCPGCGRRVIERDGYYLGEYALNGNCCRHCGTGIAGHFDQHPGQWGGNRLPVRISDYARPKPTLPERKATTMASESSSRQIEPQRETPDRPELTPEEENRVLQAAGRRVVAAVKNAPAERLDSVLGAIGSKPVLGAFVSLKRGAQLRSCCGFLGRSVPLHQALDHAAVRAAKDDPRFPPISPTELDFLDVEVWLLWGLEPMVAQGQERTRAITIGKHGLQIAKGGARGLLLPGVAIEHKMDAEEFLRAVCRKAGLPADAWKDDDTDLMTFEGYAVHGQLGAVAPSREQAAATAGPTGADVAMLADFCRRNVAALVCGATPSSYMPGGFDGSVSGAALSARLPGASETLAYSQMSLHPDLPLQSSLFELTKMAAGAVQARRLDPRSVQAVSLGVSVFWDPAMHGPLAEPKLEGVNPQRRAVMVADQGRWGLVFDAAVAPEQLVAQAAEAARLAGRSSGAVYSMEAVSTDPRVVLSNVPQPHRGPEVRPPAVAGRFYPSDPGALRREIEDLLPSQFTPEPWAGALVPHAGWVYSGRLAAAVLSRIEIPEQVIVVCPKHGRPGADWAVAPHRTWSLPGGGIASDPQLAERLAGAVAGLELDSVAHSGEHAVEVQLPLIRRLAPEARVVGIAIHRGGLEELQRFAEQLAAAIRDLPARPLLVISSDMNHYADDATTRRVDREALDCLERLDPAGLYHTVTENRISMCGMLPAVLVMETLRHLGSLNRCETVGYATSADASGDTRQVVGYAGMLFA